MMICFGFLFKKCVVNKILASGGSASAFKANIAHSNEVKALFEYVIQTYGRLDVLINNAGIMALSKIEHVEDDSINQLSFIGHTDLSRGANQ